MFQPRELLNPSLPRDHQAVRLRAGARASRLAAPRVLVDEPDIRRRILGHASSFLVLPEPAAAAQNGCGWFLRAYLSPA